jgi:hypothetical protein
LKSFLFSGFDHTAANKGMAAFINEMDCDCVWTEIQLARKARICDKTLRKVKAGEKSVKKEIYYRIIEVLAVYHGYSKIYVAFRMIKCEIARMVGLDGCVISLNNVILFT